MNAALQSYNRESKRMENRERDQMVREYLPLVRKVAFRIARHLPSTVDVDDLISAGCVGLLSAADRFDPDRGLEFSSFAEFRIKGAILDNLRVMDPIPRRSRQRIQALDKTRQKLTSEFGRPPDDDEMAQAMGLEPEEYQKMLAGLSPCMELSHVIYDKGSTPLKVTQATGLSSPHSIMAHKELRRRLVKAIKSLPERERTVISLYYYAKLSYKQIAILFDVTESRVCQIHKDAVRRMKPVIEGDVEILDPSRKKQGEENERRGDNSSATRVA